MNVLIGITGSIAIYKTCELIRLFSKSGHNVRVVMTQAAAKFISPLTFETLTRQKVLIEQNEDWSSELNHIDYAKWADIYIIAPATANTVNKAANGIADNLLLQTYLACPAPVLFAPAANTNMYMHKTTQESFKKLTIIEANAGLLACGDEGIGKMADPEEIYLKALRLINKDNFWENKKVVITAGGSVEKIDDVRFVSNFSSGKMGEALAKAFYIKGADVTLISSKKHNLSKEIKQIHVQSADEYYDAILNESPDYLIMAAAIADFKPKYTPGKLKKDSIGEQMILEMEKNIDILESLKEKNFKKVGFKAERDEKNAINYAKKALKKKNLDAICLNLLTKNDFGSDENEIIFITENDSTLFAQNSKENIALKLVDAVKRI
ncbi:phosphopantothenoylcysteine decarboxylase/phosphopantothenate--cysteine ligase [Nautilia profundicola AmH]|uniref:Coenzyme A biosynthesis bifunctional protein CoaBC n=1 Tax=Nautilia profundicola (strain ATCC BAA-1463 / DSM 18972 / AmH) TaxID=598659 RepID=B9LAA2_NAUPA|nr:bifunctional phosphopantothenoylcysteine decarboxylase/phosphopantothenate--cysteine ligase CoaBC [Nautilia profundicola]ACM93131.1 phosphopantothenoylcysteine decarboxylase/phosphopantothenate--cysteine ligase [Nautilia profundicola AmH]